MNTSRARLIQALFLMTVFHLYGYSSNAFLRAEIIQLTNGKAIKTTILEEDDESVMVKAFKGRVRIPKSQVQGIWRGEQADLLEVRNQRIAFVKGISLYEKGQFRDAAGAFQQSFGNKDKAAVFINLGAALAAQGDFKKAEENYLKATQDSPGSVPAFLNLGRLYLSVKQFKEAAAALQTVLELDPKHEGALEMLAYAQCALGNYKEAISLYERMKRSNDLHMLNNQAAAHIQLGNFERAEEILKRLMEGTPNFDRAQLNLAMLYRKKKEFEKAERCYQALLSQSGNKKPEFWISYGDFCLEKEDMAEARNAYEKALASAPESLAALSALYQLDVQEENFSQAENDLEQMIKILPDHAELQDELGLFYLRTKQPERAIPHYEQMLKTWPNFAKAQIHLGLAHAFLGKTDLAMKAWKKALEIDPDQKAAAANLKMLQDLLKGSTGK